MKAKILWVLTFLAAVGLALADTSPPTGIASASTAAVTPTATPAFTPWPTSTPMVAPTWAPMSAGPVPDQMNPQKPSPWMSSAGLGLGIPVSGNLQNAYTAGFNADLGTGLKIDDQFSFWMDLDLDLYNSKNNARTGGNNYTMIEAAFWARYRFLDSDLSPYFFAGPGVAYNENRSNSGILYDPTTGQSYIPINAYEIDFLAEGGLGLDVRLGGGLNIFLQGKLTYSFTSPHFAGFAFTDSPIIVMPFELGMLFGI